MKWILGLLITIISFTSAMGATLNLTATWTANTEPDMKEYRLYRTDGTRTLIGLTTHPNTSYPFSVTVPDGSSGTLTFVLTAVDLNNLESPDSNMASYSYDLSTSIAVTITATDNTATEAGPTTGTFTVSRTGSTSEALTVYYTVSGTATPGSDYNSLSGSVTIPAGSSTATVTMTPINDTLVEGDETVIVTLSVNAAYSIGSPNNATITIASDDVAPFTVTITATDNTATEAGPTTGTFTVSRTGSTSEVLTVYYTVSGTATPGSDYNSLSGSVTIPAGSSTATITVTPINDTVVESNETVIVTLSANAAYSVGSPNSATITITSDDVAPPTVTITATDNTATEAGPTTGTFTVSRTGSTSGALTVSYTVSGTATPGSDYNSLSGSVTIPAGSSTATITVTPINDTVVESNETVIVTLAAGAAYTVGSPGSATVTITSDDTSLPTVTITATDNTATEAGPTTGTFTVSRTGGTTGSLVVYYFISGTATPGSDYNSLSGSVTIPAGSSTATITVTPINDTAVESDETVIVTLAADAAYTVGSPGSATVTISSDDTVLPTVTITAKDNTATEVGPTTGTFTVSRTGSTSGALSVSYTVSGTATPGSDYNSLPGSVTIPAGSSTASITVTPINDTVVESNETVIVTLSANAAYSIGSPNSATITITSDDTTLPTVTITATDSTATEAGPTTGTFTVSRTGGTTGALKVYYFISGTATPGSDYKSLSGSVTIPASSSTATITVTPIKDTLVEGDETVILILAADGAYTVGSPGSATVTIVSDDASLPTVTITATDSTATEAGPTTGTFTVSRTGSTAGSLVVYYFISGTATPGSDYNSLSGNVTIPAGSSTGTITVTPIKDNVVEGDETVILVLAADAAYTVGSPGSATVTITGDDVAEVTTPNIPNGPTSGFTGATYKFSTGGSSSTLGSVEYQFDWGNGTYSPWVSSLMNASQSNIWTEASTYRVRARARCKNYTNNISSWSNSTSISVQGKPFIRVTSPNGGENCVVGDTYTITWESQYLTSSGTIYLFYWFDGKWHPITTLSSINNSYNWTIPRVPEEVTSLKPSGFIRSTSVWIGNWVNDKWECWDSSDKTFRILYDAWVCKISGGDQGGTTLLFDEGVFNGYGISLKLGMFWIEGQYSVDTAGSMSGTYKIYEFNNPTNVFYNGSFTGKVDSKSTKLTLNLKSGDTSVFNISGVRLLNEPEIPADWVGTLSGGAQGTLHSLEIHPYQQAGDEIYSYVFEFSGSVSTMGGGSCNIGGYFYLTSLKASFSGSNIYGIYRIAGAINEEGVLTGTLNITSGKISFTMTSENGNKYTLTGQIGNINPN